MKTVFNALGRVTMILSEPFVKSTFQTPSGHLRTFQVVNERQATSRRGYQIVQPSRKPSRVPRLHRQERIIPFISHHGKCSLSACPDLLSPPETHTNPANNKLSNLKPRD